MWKTFFPQWLYDGVWWYCSSWKICRKRERNICRISSYIALLDWLIETLLLKHELPNLQVNVHIYCMLLVHAGLKWKNKRIREHSENMFIFERGLGKKVCLYSVRYLISMIFGSRSGQKGGGDLIKIIHEFDSLIRKEKWSASAKVLRLELYMCFGDEGREDRKRRQGSPIFRATTEWPRVKCLLTRIERRERNRFPRRFCAQPSRTMFRTQNTWPCA